MATRGFTGRRPAPELADRLPPGQSLTEDFPVLTAGPTPRISLGDWSFTLKSGPRPVKRWTWAEFNSLPQTKMSRDIHCVTKWSKLNTPWTGVLIDDLLADAELEPPTSYTLVHSCAAACSMCAAECESHATIHEHCRVCAEACRACEQACRALLHGASFQ